MKRLVLAWVWGSSLCLSLLVVGCGGAPDGKSNTNSSSNSNATGNSTTEPPGNEPQAELDAGATNIESFAEKNAGHESRQEPTEPEVPAQEQTAEQPSDEPEGMDAGTGEGEPTGEESPPEAPVEAEPPENPTEAMADPPNAQTDSYNVDSRGVAVQGYDVVAYFLLQAPTQGDAKYAIQWSGATWHFSSDPHRKLFQADPNKYAPQYGGYCAWAVSQGYLASIDPVAWKIVNQKLYLNFSLSVQKQWEQDIPNNIAKADKNWPSLRPKP